MIFSYERRPTRFRDRAGRHLQEKLPLVSADRRRPTGRPDRHAVNTLDPVNLTGATARMQAWDREHLVKLIDFNTDGTITIDALNGTVTVVLPDTFPSQLTSDVAKYDLKITSSNTDKNRLIEGRIRLTPQETVDD